MNNTYVLRYKASNRQYFESRKTTIFNWILAYLVAPIYAVYQQWSLIGKMEFWPRIIAYSLMFIVIASSIWYLYKVLNWEFGKKVSIDDIHFQVR